MQITDLSRTDSDGPVCKDNRVSQQANTKSGEILGGILEMLISLQASTSSLKKITSLYASYYMFPVNEFLAQIRFIIKH